MFSSIVLRLFHGETDAMNNPLKPDSMGASHLHSEPTPFDEATRKEVERRKLIPENPSTAAKLAKALDKIRKRKEARKARGEW
jgi:hypothetical protein